MRKYFVLAFLLVYVAHVFGQIQLNNDEFAYPESMVNWHNINDTEGWNITQLENYNIGDTVSGSLFMMPFTEGWFGEYRGALLYKELAGDFVLTTEVTVSARDGISLPASPFSLAGIMLRTPLDYPNQDPNIDWMPNEQNYIFISIGRANQNRFSFEIKNTCDSRSCLSIVDADSTTVKMRMIRRGNELVVLSQFGDDPWTIQNRYNRNDIQVGDFGACGQLCNAPFPDTIQVGFVTYTDWDKVDSYTTAFHNTNTLHPDSLDVDPTPTIPFTPDIRAHFDYIRFDSLEIPTDWTALDISDPSQVTDIEILSQFSYHSAFSCPNLLDVVSLPVTDEIVTAYANQSVSCNLNIEEPVDVRFNCPNEIELGPGFQISTGTQFLAQIEECLED